MDANTIINFWFSTEVQPLWFNSTEAFDNKLKARFLDTWLAAADEQLESWRDSELGALALVIILDQFPLNIFRGKPLAFSTDAQSRKVARHAIEQNLDQALNDEQKAFLYMPFMHSELIEDQNRSVALFEAAGLQDNARFAQHHREIVRRFGRFPHRNEILGRTSTAEELEWLASDEAFHG
ncbi:hypothetical protein BOW53_10290 [Solemya pervernicosa gill symbiont]|uniref:DUF924 domain-containing protein n=2 Tax=Gammaproteobacteria incertae sedis TaxID=118884 RepID=A0A1T2L3S0_9GAMM|nr:DUF924 family protein [Candidatus Reidiella endopervernicosa]OOZ39755.1 hypothetical protein BOW53_10290 [Solemya pervernicosa gill symbiont]QKQ27910.1 DUF924 domain-containing protein [Candidatus Reidiella endopervernicosa]